MAKGISIHIALNYIDARHYGTNGKLPYCVNDAQAMENLARKAGYRPRHLLLNKKATSTAVLTALADAAAETDSGDKLLVTYSGHGSYFPDLNGDEKDKLDETWLLYDRMLIDDELYFAWSKFKPGVRIVLVSDSCHAGTVAKPLLLGFDEASAGSRDKSSLVEILKSEALLIYRTHKDLYDPHLRFIPSPLELEIKASIILLAGCTASELAIAIARSGRKFSLFTDELLTAYHKGGASVSYPGFINLIRDRIPKNIRQTPSYEMVGRPDSKFEQQTPFTI